MSDIAVRLDNVGRMYKLFEKPTDQIADVFGLSWLTGRRHREFWAVRNVDLQVRRGERVGLIGRNGAGKSTLLKLICDRIKPTEGHVHVNGDLQALLTIGAGFHNEFTGRENIRVALSLQGMSSAEIRLREEEIIDFSELEDFIDQPVKFYSAGMYTRLAFTVATTIRPDILIIDEVLGAGDAAFAAKCADRMRRLTQDTGATVLYVSHALDSVIQLCDRAVLVEGGRITADDDPLAIAKIYTNKIREEEEITLRSREFRLRKRDVRHLTNAADLQSHLFSIRCQTAHPVQRHKIRSAALLEGNREVARLDFGAPMDNANTAPNHIIEALGLMDWGKPNRDQKGYFRFYEDADGRYSHAPFVLSLPFHIDLKNLSLAIEADVEGADEVQIVRLTESDAIPIMVLRPGVQRVVAPMPVAPSEDKPAEDSTVLPAEPLDSAGAIPAEAPSAPILLSDFAASHSVYGSGEISIRSVDLVDEKNRSKRTFEVGDALIVQVEIEAHVPVSDFWFVICIYFRDTRPASQVFCSSKSLGIGILSGRSSISVEFDPVRLGDGEYMSSIGIYKDFDPETAREEASYCVIDRAVMFKIYQPPTMAKSFGSFAHAVRWRHGAAVVEYDPARDHRKLAVKSDT